MELVSPKEYNRKVLPFIEFVCEDKSSYKPISSIVNPNTGHHYIDPFNYFLVGNSGGILLNMNFVFVDMYKIREVAAHYERKGRYTDYEEGSLEYDKFWKRERNRRVKGIIAPCRVDVKDYPDYVKATGKSKEKYIKDLYITGNQYSYINYGRMDRVPTEEETAELESKGEGHRKTIQGFPTFRDCDWWYFIIDKFARDNSYNLIVAKARRKGYSYKIGNTNATEMNLYKDITICNAAYKEEYLVNEGAIAHMTREALHWYETQTGWVRGFDVKRTLDEFILGYQDAGTSSIPHEWSTCKNRWTNANTSVFIGSKAYRLNNEECGKFNNLYDYLGVTMSLMESGMVKVGMMTSWGTAGTEDSNWADFEHMFRNCTYDGLRFENVWDINQRSNVCGFFHPQVWGLEPCIDSDGNSLLFSAYWYDKKDKERNGDILREDKRITYYAQRANTPNEAFINTTVNIFASESLNHHLLDIKTNPSLQFYRDGIYEIVKDEVVLLSREEVMKRGRAWHDYITDVPHRTGTDVVGCVREYYPPQRVNGEIQPNMYFISVDPTGVDKNDQKEITEDYSLYTMQVYTYFHPQCTLPPRTLVAEYTGRLPRREDNDKIVLLASMRYNAKVLVEANRGELISNFKKWKQRGRLMKDPTKYFTRKESMIDKEEYGITISGDKKMDGLKMLKDSLYEIVGYKESSIPTYRLEYILSESFLKELQVFTINGNFDRISAALIAEYEFSKEELKKKEEFNVGSVRSELDKTVGKGGRRTLGRILARA